jgi:hypothetical protein
MSPIELSSACRVRFSTLGAGLLLTCCVGCGNGLVDVVAQLKLDGKPLEKASVSLVSAGETQNRSASGRTDAEGKVRFTTFEPNDGVLPGTYKVVVVKSPASTDEEILPIDPNNPEDMERYRKMQSAAILPYTRTALPSEYINTATTPHSCTIDGSSSEVVFEL